MTDMEVSWNGTPKSSIYSRISLINHPAMGYSRFMEPPHIPVPFVWQINHVASGNLLQWPQPTDIWGFDTNQSGMYDTRSILDG